MYVDDILIAGNDGERQKLLNIHLANEVEITTLEKMKYFIEIEVTHSKKKNFHIAIEIHLLQEIGKTTCKP